MEPPDRDAALPPSSSGRATASALRASLTFLLILSIAGGLAYPATITYAAGLLNPAAAAGSLVFYPNGTAYGSSLLGENITNPAMFWLRPSLIDDQAFNASGGSNGPGNEVPLGPTDPALLNETRYYVNYYFNTSGNLTASRLANLSVPLPLVAPSASGLDPDLPPAAVLVQIPRVSHYSGLSQSWLLDFVNAHIVGPVQGFVGPQYVNVVALDVLLLAHLPAGSGYR